MTSQPSKIEIVQQKRKADTDAQLLEPTVGIKYAKLNIVMSPHSTKGGSLPSTTQAEPGKTSNEAPSTLSFMSLPSELRNIVYGLCLSSTDYAFFFEVTKKDPTSGDQRLYCPCGIAPRPIITGLLLLSKAVHAEAASYLYAQEFVFEGMEAAKFFLNRIGPSHRSLLRDVEFSMCGRDKLSTRQEVFSKLAEAIHIQRVRIVYRGYFITLDAEEDGEQFAIMLLETGREWFQEMARRHHCALAGIEVLSIEGHQIFQCSSIVDTASCSNCGYSDAWKIRNAEETAEVERVPAFELHMLKLLETEFAHFDCCNRQHAREVGWSNRED